MFFWIAFHLFILGMLYLDLKVFHNKDQPPNIKSTTLFALFWIGLALGFNLLVGIFLGYSSALTFFTAYLLESSLSIDNLFVFISIFHFFQIDLRYQHRVLFFGVLGALVCRILFILSGIALLEEFPWMYFVFGGILCLSAFYLFKRKEAGKEDFKDTWIMKIATRFLRVDKEFHQGRFSVIRNGKFYITTLFLALMLIEGFDILFAIDSIPAILSITSDPFLAYTSNVFAVLGLRSFYFFLVSLHQKFTHLKSAIILLLLFIGVKLIIMPWVHISNEISLLVIGATLLTSICLSLRLKR